MNGANGNANGHANGHANGNANGGGPPQPPPAWLVNQVDENDFPPPPNFLPPPPPAWLPGANGQANGHANGHANGVNGHANGGAHGGGHPSPPPSPPPPPAPPNSPPSSLSSGASSIEFGPDPLIGLEDFLDSDESHSSSDSSIAAFADHDQYPGSGSSSNGSLHYSTSFSSGSHGPSPVPSTPITNLSSLSSFRPSPVRSPSPVRNVPRPMLTDSGMFVPGFGQARGRGRGRGRGRAGVRRNLFGAVPGQVSPFGSPQGAVGGYASPQGTPRMYGHPRPRQNLFGSPGSGHLSPYGSPQGYASPQGTPRMQGHPRPRHNLFAGPGFAHLSPYGSPQGAVGGADPDAPLLGAMGGWRGPIPGTMGGNAPFNVPIFTSRPSGHRPQLPGPPPGAYIRGRNIPIRITGPRRNLPPRNTPGDMTPDT